MDRIELFSEDEFSSARSRYKLPLSCNHCNKTFLVQKNYIQKSRAGLSNRWYYCSTECAHDAGRETVSCLECGKDVHSTKYVNRKFCNRSCAAKYNNRNKSHGTRRSKIETWIEEQIKYLYPNTEILFNNKDTINSELDIFFPKLELAIELNGVFHYEPIYGSEKLKSIQNNDDRKFQACLENNIELCIIDISPQNRFTEKSSKKYLDIIIKILAAKGVNAQNRVEVS